MIGLVKLAGVRVPSTEDEVKEFKTNNKDQDRIDGVVYRYLKQNYPDECLSWSKYVRWKLVEKVPLDKITMARRPGGAREKDKVKGIAGAIKEGKSMEPVVLVKLPDGTLKIADGYHRTLAFKHADKKHLKAFVAEVPIKAGPWDKEMHEKKLNVGKKAGYGMQGEMLKEASPMDLMSLVNLGSNLYR